MITFQVLSATFTEDFGGSVSLADQIKPVPEEPISSPERERTLHFRVQCDPDEHISLSTGEGLNNLRGHVTLYPQIGELEPDAKGIGVMSYHGAVSEFRVPLQYFVEVQLPPDQFEVMFRAACLGRIPSHVTVEERGMLHPDEFSSIWDEQKAPHLHVASIRFSVPLEALDSAKGSETETALLAAVSAIDNKVKWVIGLVAVWIATALLRTL